MTTLLALYRRPDGGDEALATFLRRYHAEHLPLVAQTPGPARDPRPAGRRSPRRRDRPRRDHGDGLRRPGRRSTPGWPPTRCARPAGTSARSPPASRRCSSSRTTRRRPESPGCGPPATGSARSRPLLLWAPTEDRVDPDRADRTRQPADGQPRRRRRSRRRAATARSTAWPSSRSSRPDVLNALSFDLLDAARGRPRRRSTPIRPAGRSS